MGNAIRATIAALVLGSSLPLSAAVQLTPVASGLASPVFAGNAGDGSNRLFVVEQRGVVRVLQPGATTASVFLDISAKVVAGGERGLLGLAFHPQYAANGRFFVYYTRAADGALVIAEYKVSANPDVAGPAETILLTIAHPTNQNHNGGMLAFGPDDYLYIGVGDGGSGNDPPDNAQNLDVLLGKILRIDVDHPDAAAGTAYSAPADNPFVNAPGRDEIYAYGLRNPWRFSFDRVRCSGRRRRPDAASFYAPTGARNDGWRVYEGSACTGNDPLLAIPPTIAFRSSTTPTTTGAARSPAATSTAATRGPCPGAPMCSATTARARSSRGTARHRRCCSTRRATSRRSARTSTASFTSSISADVEPTHATTPCTYAISPTDARAARGSMRTTGAACAWNAASATRGSRSAPSARTADGTVTYVVVAPATRKSHGTIGIAAARSR